MQVKLLIKRCDPSRREVCEPFLEAFTIEAAEGMTVLEALIEISETKDATLAFRRSCRSAICGSCAVKINGFPKLACSTQVLMEYKKHGRLTIEPLGNHAVIKDLVVDMGPYWEKMEKITPYLTPGDSDGGECRAVKMKKEEKARIDDSQKCIMCASCNSSCNALEIDRHYLGPAALAKAWRFVGDAREGHAGKRLETLSLNHGVWDCVRCVHCTEYCPKDVKPLEAIEKLRAEAMKEGFTDNHGAKHVESMLDSIKRVGRLDEAAMSFKTLGLLKSFGMIPFGIRMGMHGKAPHPIVFPSIEGIEEVRKIYEVVERKRRKEKAEK
ncbi:MAG: succinate dehydrogenase/fumarate reductase iron-sulfur subunit [Deltaproteobacteria bacterium]|nr:succinate dehydrogenase/fumarate reductase iron-sulfur subunit [Deltaproteobacteria bacterium]